MADRTILVIEDEAAIRSGLRDALLSEGYSVIEAADGPAGLRAGLTQDPDLIVLDLMLPGLGGYELLRRLREDHVETPVLVLTARGLEADKVKGFALGADDYIVKPFGIEEFLARVASRLRTWDRERGRAPRDAIRLGEVIVDFEARTVVRRNGEPLSLTQKELDLLRFLVAHEGRALSRARILKGVWEGEIVSRVIDSTILNLRKKLEKDPARPRHILSVRGVGYRFSRIP